MITCRRLAILGFTALLGWWAPTQAAAGDMRFKVMQDCYQADCELVALGVGSITPQTPEALNSFRSRHPQIKRFFFHSPGGDVQGGLKIGLTLRKYGLDASLTSEMRCYSACAYAFLGGNKREVRPGGMIGVHRFRSHNGKADEQLAQALVGHLTQYVQSMGASPQLLSVASVAGSDEMVGIDWEDARTLRVDNTTAGEAKWSLEYLEETLAVSGVELDKGSDRKMTILAAEAGSEVLVMALVEYPDLGPNPSRLPAGLRVCFPQVCLSKDKPSTQEWDKNVRYNTWVFDTSQFLEVLEGSATYPNAEITFVVEAGTEQTVVAGKARAFNALFQKTGPSENYIRVLP